METKFSSGPWAVVRAPYFSEAKDENFIRVDQEGEGFCLAALVTDVVELREKAEANAHLIAAAPDLYSALDACQKALALLVSPQAIVSSSVTHAWATATAAEVTARAALSKALGTPSPLPLSGLEKDK